MTEKHSGLNDDHSNEIDYAEIYKELCNGDSYHDIATRHGMTSEAIRGGIRRYRKKHALPSPFATEEATTVEEKELAQFINVPHTLEELAELTGKSLDALSEEIDEMRDHGMNIRIKNGVYQLRKDLPLKRNNHKQEWNGGTVRFGVVSDTHMGSIYEQSSFLHHAYNYLHQRGVTTVYHAGDVTEGQYNQRAGHIYECHKQGYDEQLNWVIENYPKIDGVTTYFITGNHDATFLKQSGALIGTAIEHNRPDMVYLGADNARVHLTPNCVLELNHPADGASYAVSYSVQKYIESLEGGKLPNIIFNGHHHKACYVMHRGIHAFEAGTTQGQSGFMRGKKIPAHVGAWLVTLDFAPNGSIKRIVPEFIALDETILNDY